MLVYFPQLCSQPHRNILDASHTGINPQRQPSSGGCSDVCIVCLDAFNGINRQKRYSQWLSSGDNHLKCWKNSASSTKYIFFFHSTHQGGSIPNIHPFELWNSYISLRCSPFLYLKNLIRYDFAQTETVLLENAPSSMNAVVYGASSVEEIWNLFPVKFIVCMWSFLFVAFYVETLMW